MKINENTKITLTFKQLKRLVKEETLIDEGIGSNEFQVALWFAGNFKYNGIKNVAIAEGVKTKDLEEAMSLWDSNDYSGAFDLFNKKFDDDPRGCGLILCSGSISTGNYPDIVCLTTSKKRGNKVVMIEAKADPMYALSNMSFNFGKTRGKWSFNQNYTSSRIPEKNKQLLSWLCSSPDFSKQLNNFVNDFITKFNKGAAEDAGTTEYIKDVGGRLAVANQGRITADDIMIPGRPIGRSYTDYARKILGLKTSNIFRIDGSESISKYFGLAYSRCEYIACGGEIHHSNWQGDTYIEGGTDVPKIFTVNDQNPYNFSEVQPIEGVGTGIGVKIYLTYDNGVLEDNYVPLLVKGTFFLYNNATDTLTCDGYTGMSV